MNREDRQSVGMTPEKVSKTYEILSKAFTERREKLREQEARLNAVVPNMGESSRK